jgi:D-alanyl-D-alanine carboxypeptidase
VPQQGKFIVSDLSKMQVTLYQDGVASTTYPILTKGRPGTPWDTPSGLYTVRTKEENHLSSVGKVYMPYSMQFMGNYFIHGWPYYPDGTPVASTYSGGCIRLSTADAKTVYAFADGRVGTTDGTGIFVYDPARDAGSLSPLTISTQSAPPVHAAAYLVADIDTGSVYAESGGGVVQPISSTTNLMTALVANEIISFDKKIPVERDAITLPVSEASSTAPHPLVNEFFAIGDLLYPLLMQTNATVADYIAGYYGPKGFVSWMNATAHSLDMNSTTFADADDHSHQNAATTDDVYRLVSYLADKKSFILDIAATKQKQIVAESGEVYQITNALSATSSQPLATTVSTSTDQIRGATAEVASIKVGKDTRRVAIVVLQSDSPQADAALLTSWWKATVAQGSQAKNAACLKCIAPKTYRVIEK